jgi:hypothetical protein
MTPLAALQQLFDGAVHGLRPLPWKEAHKARAAVLEALTMNDAQKKGLATLAARQARLIAEMVVIHGQKVVLDESLPGGAEVLHVGKELWEAVQGEIPGVKKEQAEEHG